MNASIFIDYKKIIVLLKKHYGNMISFEKDAEFRSILRGKFGTNVFTITYQNGKYLMVTCDNSEIFRLLSELFFNYLDFTEPICFYQMVDKENKIATNVVEWDMIDPDKRLREIVNEKNDSYDIIDLVIVGDHQIDDYKNKDEEKIYGIYPGNAINKDYQEFELFINLYLLSTLIASSFERSDATNDEMIEMEYGLEYLMAKTKVYGTDVSDPQRLKHITSGEVYEAWYNYHLDYLKTFDEEKLNELNTKLASNIDISSLSPKPFNEIKKLILE